MPAFRPGVHHGGVGADRLADGALIEQRASRLQAAAQECPGAADHHAGRLTVREDLGGIGPVRGEGLLGVEVLARGDRRPRHADVGGRRGQVEDDLDVGSASSASTPPPGSRLWPTAQPPALRSGPRMLPARSSEPVATAQVEVGDVPAADDPDPRPDDVVTPRPAAQPATRGTRSCPDGRPGGPRRGRTRR